jgi:hypothetical protein
MNNELFIKMALDGWHGQIKATNSIFDKLSDEQLMQEVAPGRNRGIYLLGHLVAVHDMMLPLLMLGDPQYPELHHTFVDLPDKAVADLPSIGDLKAQWVAQNEKTTALFAGLSPDEWFSRHSNISQQDFEKEPHRNRLNVLLVRTNHLSNHRGQLTLLLPKSDD